MPQEESVLRKLWMMTHGHPTSSRRKSMSPPSPMDFSFIKAFVVKLYIRHRMSMALPDVKSLADCIDYSKTVHPYWPQLLALPQQVGQQISNTQALQILYISTNPVISGLALSIAIAPIFLVAAEINRNYSQVDRAWSILPTIFVAHFCFYAHAVGLPAERLDALFAASTVWSVWQPAAHGMGGRLLTGGRFG